MIHVLKTAHEINKFLVLMTSSHKKIRQILLVTGTEGNLEIALKITVSFRRSTLGDCLIVGLTCDIKQKTGNIETIFVHQCGFVDPNQK